MPDSMFKLEPMPGTGVDRDNPAIFQVSPGRYTINGHPAYEIVTVEYQWAELTGARLHRECAVQHYMMPPWPWAAHWDRYDLVQDLRKLWWVTMPRQIDARRTHGRFLDLQISILHTRIDTWSLGWFNHHTWDVPGRTDEEYVASFHEYVQRHASYASLDAVRLLDYKREADRLQMRNHPGLMGAEDWHRWCSGGEADERDYEVLPCRCLGCKRGNVVRINH